MTLELGRVTDRKPPFKYSALARVGFSDTDAQGIVYYGRYPPYFDVARAEYLRHLELPHDTVGSEEQFLMRALKVDYHDSARFDDLLEVFIRFRRIGRSSLTAAFVVYRVDDDRLMCEAELTNVLVRLSDRSPVPVPEDYRAVVRSFEGPDLEEVTG